MENFIREKFLGRRSERKTERGVSEILENRGGSGTKRQRIREPEGKEREQAGRGRGTTVKGKKFEEQRKPTVKRLVRTRV